MLRSKKFREIEFHECFAVEETIITKASRNTGIHSKVIQFHDFFFFAEIFKTSYSGVYKVKKEIVF